MKRKLGETKKIQWEDLTGKVFGNLIAQWPAGRNKGHGVYWLCLCSCGRTKHTAAERLKSGYTKSCGCLPKHVTHGKSKTQEYGLWKVAQRRAHKRGIIFNITHEDINIPKVCPLLGIPLYRSKGRLFHDNSPSLDRIIPELGYVKGNIQVISFRANRIKCNASLEEIKTLVQNWEKQECVS